jgi:hypothetical protein
LVPATIFMEDNVVDVTIELAKKDFNIIWYLLINSSLAYFVNLTNFLVTKHTSALTLQVCPVIPFHTESSVNNFFAQLGSWDISFCYGYFTLHVPLCQELCHANCQ